MSLVNVTACCQIDLVLHECIKPFPNTCWVSCLFFVLRIIHVSITEVRTVNTSQQEADHTDGNEVAVESRYKQPRYHLCVWCSAILLHVVLILCLFVCLG